MEITVKEPRGYRRHFSFPHEVVDDPSLSVAEKRAILAEWADASAIESFPTLRLLPGTSFPVTFSSVMDARDQLDRQTVESFNDSNDFVHRLVVADFARRRRDNNVGG